MKTKPYKHQAREFRRYRRAKARMLFWQMRTGKTKAMIDLACYNYFAGYIDAVVVIAPNGVHENWVRRELNIHHWKEADFMAVSWSSRRVKKAAFRDELAALMTYKDGLAWLALNEECFTVPLARAYLKRFMAKRRFLIIFDESQDFGVPGSKRTKAARAVAKKAVMNRTLSGTPLDNSPLKAFSQFELLEPGALGFKNYADFKDHFAVYREERTKGGRKYPVLEEYINLDELKEKMAKYTSVVLREDCDDMPKLVRTQRFYEPSEEQMKLYKQIFHDSVIEAKDGTLTAFEGGVRSIKMQQVLGGYYVDPSDQEIVILPGKNPRLDILMEEIEEARRHGKFIIWARFRPEIAMIAKRLKDAGIPFVEYHGGIVDHKKREARERFLEDDSLEGFLGQPRAGGKGLDLSTARTVLRYSYSFDAEEQKQAEERATKIGGVDIAMVDIVASNWIREDVPQLIDSYILESLEDKTLRAEDLSRSGMQAYLLKHAGLIQ